MQQDHYALQPDRLHTASSAPPTPEQSRAAPEPTTQTKRSRFFSRNGVAPEASSVSRSASVPTRSSSTSDAAQPDMARASSMMAAPEHPRRPTAMDAPQLSEAAPRQATSSGPKLTSQRSTEEDAPQPDREPAGASQSTAGSVAAQLPESSAAVANTQVTEVDTLRQPAVDVDADSGHNSRDQV